MISQPLSEPEIEILKSRYASVLLSIEPPLKVDLAEIRKLSYRGMMTSHATNEDANSYKGNQDSFRVQYARSAYQLVKNFNYLSLKKEAISSLEKVIQFGLTKELDVTLYKAWLSDLQAFL